MSTNHAAILAGGFGKRLGNLTRKVPKPLLKINGLEFISYLILNLIINDFKNIYILTYYKDHIFRKKFHNLKFGDVTIKCIKEKTPLGTGGSIFKLKKFNKDFLVINGDSFVNISLKKFNSFNKKNIGKILLVKNKNYKSNKKLTNLKINKNSKIYFCKKGFMNAGVYLFSKKFFKKVKNNYCSLEEDIFPSLIEKKQIEGEISKLDFVDIGIKKNLQYSSLLLKQKFKTKAIFFDRDGTLNKNFGYVSKYDNFKWLKGSIDTLKFLNFFKIKSIVVTNQSGIGRGFYTMKDFLKLNKQINKFLKKNHANIDKFYCAPYFKESKHKKYKKGKHLRKPNNGMIQKAFKKFKLSNKNCLMVGDKYSDLLAAKKAKIKFYKKENSSLFNQIIKNLYDFQFKS